MANTVAVILVAPRSYVTDRGMAGMPSCASRQAQRHRRKHNMRTAVDGDTVSIISHLIWVNCLGSALLRECLVIALIYTPSSRVCLATRIELQGCGKRIARAVQYCPRLVAVRCG